MKIKKRWLLIPLLLLLVIGFILNMCVSMLAASFGAPSTCDLQVEVHVWLDENEDGEWQKNEPPLSGIVPYLRTTPQLMYTVPSASDGIAEIDAGYKKKRIFDIPIQYCGFINSQKISIEVPEGYQLTTKSKQRYSDQDTMFFGLKATDPNYQHPSYMSLKHTCTSYPIGGSPPYMFVKTATINGKIWFSHGNFIGQYDSQTDTILWQEVISGMSTPSFAVSNDQKLWVRESGQQIYVIDGEQITAINKLGDIELKEMSQFTNTPTGNIWVATSSSMIFYDTATQEAYQYSEFPKNRRGGRSVSTKRDDLVVHASDTNFSIGRGNPAKEAIVWETYPDENSPIPPTHLTYFYDAVIDDLGRVWFDNGNAYYDTTLNEWYYPQIDETFISRDLLMGTENSLYDTKSLYDMQSFEVGSNNQFWLNTFPNHGVFYYLPDFNNKQWETWPVLRIEGANYLTAIDANEDIWLTTDSDLKRCEIEVITH